MKSIALAAAFAALVGACGGSPTTTVTPPPAGTTIGPSGGTVTSADGAATLTFPAGALASSTSITTAAMTNPPASPGLVTASAYDFGPSGSQFAQPVTIKLTYQPSQVPVGISPIFLRLFLRNGSTWDSVPGSTVDTVAHTVTGTTTHFSGYASCTYICPPPGLGPQVGANFVPTCCIMINQGGSGTDVGYLLAVGYTGGSPNIIVDNPPTGITGSVALSGFTGTCSQTCGSMATVTLYAATTTPPGRYTVTLKIVATPGAAPDSLILEAVQVVAVPGFVLSTAPSSLAIAQGNTSVATVSATRTNFTAPITLSASQLPSGVTASFNPVQLTDTTLSSRLTLTAGASVAAGTTNITITGVASGLANQTQTVPLTVAAFSIAATPASITLAPGGSGSTGVKVSRAGGFSGVITYGVSGLPTGLTAAVTATSVADSSALTVTAASNLAAGSYPINVTATSGNSTQQALVNVTVATSTVIALDWSQCASKPVWFAYQDGNGPWTPVAASGNVYNVPTLAAGKGGIAFVVSVPNGHTTEVNYGTQVELSSPILCSSTLTLNGSVSGMLPTDIYTFVSFGGGSAPVPSNGPFQLSNVTNGAHDLIAFVTGSTGNRLIIQRGASGVGAINVGTGAVAAATAMATVNGTSGGSLSQQMAYLTGACTSGLLYSQISGNTNPLQVFGVPPALQLPGDLHSLMATELMGSTGRTAATMFHTLGATSVTLGGAIAPTVTSLAGPYKRLQAVVSLPSDYAFLQMGMSFASSSNFVGLWMTAGYAGSQSFTLAMPDFSAVPGYSTSWVAATSDVASYSMNATSAPPYAGPPCGEGVTTKTSYVSGSN